MPTEPKTPLKLGDKPPKKVKPPKAIKPVKAPKEPPAAAPVKEPKPPKAAKTPKVIVSKTVLTDDKAFEEVLKGANKKPEYLYAADLGCACEPDHKHELSSKGKVICLGWGCTHPHKENTNGKPADPTTA